MTRRLHLARLCALVFASAAAAACDDSAGPIEADPPAQYITVRRAWLPGERDSTIARIRLGRELVIPYIGDVSDDADRFYPDLDSVTVVIANPAYGVMAANEAGLVMAPQFAGTWNITGIDVRIVNNDVTPIADTLHYIGVFWSNPAESNWKGFALGGANSSGATTTLPLTLVNTTAFNTAFGKSGVGAGEQRATTNTYWEANGPGVSPNNTLIVNSAAYGGTSVINTGPFLGGTIANGTMLGRMRTIDMTRLNGATAPATFQVDLNFSATSIAAVRYVCIFRSPCTSNVPIIQASRPGPLPDSLVARLPWVAAMPWNVRPRYLASLRAARASGGSLR